MPTNPNMVAIQTVTVGAGGASSIEFTSIPQTYTDLLIVLSGRTSNAAAADDFYVSFNSTTTNYSNRTLSGNGSTASSGNSTAWAGIYGVTNGANATASTFSNAQIYVPNYTSSNNKSVSSDSVSENNATGAFSRLVAGLWSNTSAINQITITTDTGDVAQYSTATLYGIKKD